jgi:hypothetical protein
MRTTDRAAIPAALLSLLALPAAAQDLDLVQATHGFGQLLPHQIEELDGAGLPTGQRLDVTDLAILQDNLTLAHGVLPVPQLPTGAILPGGSAGNQFLSLRFNGTLDPDSILDSNVAGQANSGLLGSIEVLAVDPITGSVSVVPGRAFVGGKTYAGTAVGGQLELQSWVVRAGGGLAATAIDNDGDGVPDGLGFPGTETGFSGDLDLVDRGAFVFVPDSDGDLTTHETFPTGKLITVRATSAVRDLAGRALWREVFSAVEVGPPTFGPEIIFTANGPFVEPPNASVDVDPATEIRVRFSEPIQPLHLGQLVGRQANLSASMVLGYGAPAFASSMPFTVRPPSVLDLSTWMMTPVMNFPGTGSVPSEIGNRVDVVLNSGKLGDLDGQQNLLSMATFFETGEGPGLVNAPVTPDAIVVGGGRGVGILDLNGFGAGTGSPRYDPAHQSTQQSHSNYPDNPNLVFQAGIDPPLTPGTTTLDGGSAGVLTLTRDTNLDTALLRAPTVAYVSDLALGQALDLLYNNAQFPFGCQAAGGSICALDGLQVFQASLGGPSTLAPDLLNPLQVVIGGGNPVSWAPHPNPPALALPLACAVPMLGVAPTSAGPVNLLVPGDAFGDPSIGLPPTGLLSAEQNAFFVGPTQGQVILANCDTYAIRQQVGHLLYIADRVRGEVVVINSNRMTVVDRVVVAAATELALAPGLDYLAVTQADHDQVSFIDVDPASGTFHQVVKVTTVGDTPTGIAWDPGNEDILVCNSGDASLSVLSAFSLDVRKTVTNLLTGPVDVAITPRQDVFGYQRNVYWAYILQRDGSVAVFESGPNGVNGWGYDDVVGLAPFTFLRPKAIQVDPTGLGSAVWIAHEGPIDLANGSSGPLGEGAVSRLWIDSSTVGQLNLTAADAGTPQFRSMTLGVSDSVGESVLTGIPTDLAPDDLRNLGSLEEHRSVFGAGVPKLFNGKGLVREVAPGTFRPVSNPAFLVVAVPVAKAGGGGRLDVLRSNVAGTPRLDVDAFAGGVQSTRAPGVRVLAHYFRQ